jgi:hypothetical protein
MADSFTPEQIENMNKFFELINSSLTPLTEMQKAELAAAAARQTHTDRLKELNQVLKERLSTSAIDLGKALTSTQQGAGKFGTVINSATEAVGDFGIAMGGLFKGIGYVIKAFGALTQAAFEQNDQLMRAYEGLSSIGSVTEGGLEKLQTQLNSVGLATAEYEKLINVLRPVTGSLAAFRGSVSGGATALNDIMQGFVGPDNELERSLRRIGYTTTDIQEGVADYVQMQTRLGRAQGKTTEQLTKESHKYLIEMKGLQELTGMTRDEQQKARDDLLSDARFSMHLSSLNETEAKNLNQAMILYQKVMGPEAAKGLKDRIVNFGDITTEAAGQSVMRNNQEFENILKVQREGPEALAKFIFDTVKNTEKTIKSFEGTLRFAEDGGKSLGLGNEVLAGVLKYTNSDFEKLSKIIKEVTEITNNQGGQLEDNIRGDQKSRATALGWNAAMAKAGQGLISIFVKVQEVMFSFGKMIARMIDWITKKTPYLDDTDLSKFFEESAPSSSSSSSSNSGSRSSSRLSSDDEKISSSVGSQLAPSMKGRKSNDVLDKLNFGGQRAERTGGGDATPQLLALAEKIHDEYPGTIFTALNDKTHHQEKFKGSLHTIGKALDFVFADGYEPNDFEADRITKHLRMLGASKVDNEYKNMSKNATGKHFHVEVARQGGLFSGKDTGYPVMLHGKKESVWPEKDLTAFMKDVQKTSLEQYKQELMTQILPTSTGGSSGDSNVNVIVDAFNMFSNKLDTMIGEQRRNNGIQDEILTYSRA